MEPGIKITEGGVERPRNGDAGRHVRSTEHRKTTSCVRCAGLLVNEWCYDLENTGVHKAEVLRCVQCGYRVDPTIAHNRAQRPVVDDSKRRVRFQHWVERERVAEAVST